MKKYSNFIGIDVSKNTLDIIGINKEFKETLAHQKIENTITEIKDWCKNILKNTIIVFEDTGVYNYVLAEIFSKYNIDYIRAPSLDINLSKGISRGKSDKKDALMIAKYLVTNHYKLKPSTSIDNEVLKLRILHTQRDKIVKAIKGFSSNLEYNDFLPSQIY